MSVSKKTWISAGAVFVTLTGLGISTLGGMETTIANPQPRQQAPKLLAQKLTNLTIVFPNRSDSTDLQTKANAVAAFLSKELGIPVAGQIGDDTAAVEALRACLKSFGRI